MLRLLAHNRNKMNNFARRASKQKTQMLGTVKNLSWLKTYRRRTHTIKQKLGPPVLFFSYFFSLKQSKSQKDYFTLLHSMHRWVEAKVIKIYDFQEFKLLRWYFRLQPLDPPVHRVLNLCVNDEKQKNSRAKKLLKMPRRTKIFV